MTGVNWLTAHLGTYEDVIAPDGSIITPLVQVRGGSLVHCTLPPGRVTQAVRHRSVEEVWYCLGGGGQLWRHDADTEEIVDLTPGVAVTIPLGTGFQFRAADAGLAVLITTMPPWPGNDEAVSVEGRWRAQV
jgi:mannose-6-phosphate isomerase-like protein (cupin superfamily)